MRYSWLFLIALLYWPSAYLNNTVLRGCLSQLGRSVLGALPFFKGQVCVCVYVQVCHVSAIIDQRPPALLRCCAPARRSVPTPVSPRPASALTVGRVRTPHSAQESVVWTRVATVTSTANYDGHYRLYALLVSGVVRPSLLLRCRLPSSLS